MPAVLALPAFWGAVGSAALGTGAIVGAKMQSGAARDAAKLTTDAATTGAKLQDDAAQRAEAFQRQEAENVFQNAEVARHGNYDLNAARERRLGSVGEMYGQGPREIPAYVPGVDPNYTGGMPSVGQALSGPNASAPATGGVDPKVTSFIADWQKSHPVSEGIAPLAAAISKQFPTVSRYMYGATPSDNELNVGGQKYKVLGGENTPGAYWYVPGTNDSPGATAQRQALGSVGSYLNFQPAPIAPALQMPRPYGSVGSYL